MKNVTFKRIEIENFLSVGDEMVDIDFKTGLNIITGINHDKEDSKNGVGKSTIADALFFCLFGETIRELKKEEIINNINQKKCRVQLQFDITENDVTDSYILERKIKPDNLLFTKNGKDITESSVKKTANRISEIIGANPEVFKNSVIMTVNGTIPFMAQKKVEKRKFCEGLFNLGVFQDMLLESRKKFNAIKSEIDIEQTKHKEVARSLAIYMNQKEKKDNYRKERVNTLLSRKEDNLRELEKLEGTIVKIDDSSVKEFKENIALLETKEVSIQKEIDECIRNLATYEEQLKHRTAILKKIKHFGSECEMCRRVFTDEDKNDHKQTIELAQKDVDNLKKYIEESKSKEKELKTVKDKCRKAINKQKDNISELKDNINKNKTIESRINQLTSWNKQIKVDIETLDKECEEFDELVDTTRNRLTRLDTTLSELNKRLKILDAVKYVVSEEGVKSYIIKKVLKVLNTRLAYYINKMDAPCRFKFNEYFGEQIINEKGQECSYNNFSSGEKKRIDLAILFTFMDIRRLQGNTYMNLTFYDEVLDTSLDDKGIEAFLNILNSRVEKYNEACYIISHKRSAIKSATSDVVFLEKKKGFTTIGDLTEEDMFIRKL